MKTLRVSNLPSYLCGAAYTLVFALMCMALQVFVGTPLGIVAATHHNGLIDRAAMFLALPGVSIPAFWLALMLAMMLVLIFAVNLGWLPTSGVNSGIASFILPCVANSFAGIATQARHMRSSMLEVIRSDCVTTAKAKGLSQCTILFKHMLPNALIPIITMVGNGMGMMLGGTVIIENVFAIPGIPSCRRRPCPTSAWACSRPRPSGARCAARASR